MNCLSRYEIFNTFKNNQLTRSLMKFGRRLKKKHADFPQERISGREKIIIPDLNLLKNFIEQSSEGICLINNQGLIIEWNQAMTDIYEVPREKYLNRPVWKFDFEYLPENRRTEAEKKILKEFIINYLKSPKNERFFGEFEKEINGRIKTVQYTVFPINTPEGKFFGRINLDVSEKKDAEEKNKANKKLLEQVVEQRTHDLQRSEARLRLLLQSIPMAYYSYNPANRADLWYSEQIEQLTGFSADELKNRPDLWISRINPEDFARVKGTFDNMVTNHHVSCEYRWADARGQEIWINDQAVLIEATESHPQQIIGCFMDITQRKEAEYALIESERNYREIFDSSSDAVFIHNISTGKIEDVNDTMLKMYETNYADVLKNTIEHFSAGYPPYTGIEAQRHIDAALKKEYHQFEWLAKREDNSLFWADVILKPILLSGELKIMAVVRNIDAKKHAEEQIRYKNDFEKLILSISTRFINIPHKELDSEISSGIHEICEFAKTDTGYLFLFDVDYNYVSLRYLWQSEAVNLNPEQLQHLSAEETYWHTNQIKSDQVVIVEKLDDLPPEAGNLKKLIAHQGVYSFIDVPLVYQNSIIGFIGVAVGNPGRKWHSYEVSLLKLTGQVFVNAIKRKESSQQLVESEEKYRLLVESQTDLITKFDPSGNFLFVSPSYCEIIDATEEELLTRKTSPVIHEEDQKNTLKSMESLFRPPHTCFFEQRIMTKKGWRWIAWNNKAILGADNEVQEIISVGRDITYQKGVEEALRRSEDRFRSIVQHSSDIILIVDSETSIVYDTPTVMKILGYHEGFLVGKKGMEFVHPDDLDSVRQNLRNVIQEKNFFSPIELRFKHSDGRWIPLEGVGINMIDHPSIQGIVVTLRDITERKQTEKRIIDAVIKTEEQERERFAKNLHDDLGPLLSSLKMYINSLNTASEKKKQEFIITQLNEVVKEAIQTTKDVSNDLSPHILLNYGLVSAIDNFIKKVPAAIKLNFTNSLLSERYSNSIENSFYRIIKELINNTLKHANASQIEIILEERGQYLSLFYSDNGKGFDMKNRTLGMGSGMGLSNIISRARSLNGSYEFQTLPGEGFSFKINIPMNQTLE
jgi:PAS domain S-box-containing protein